MQLGAPDCDGPADCLSASLSFYHYAAPLVLIAQSSTPPTHQIARAREVKAHFLQKQAQETKNKREYAEKAATGVIVSLGLVEGDEEKEK